MQSKKLGGGLVGQPVLYETFLQCLVLSRNTALFKDDVEKLAMEDMINVEKNDPACRSIAQVVLYFKSYNAIEAYRMSHILWKVNRRGCSMYC